MGERLLIVDDEDALRESLKRVFLRDGYEVDAVSSSEDALRNIEEKTYDLIVTDIILPGMNGIELLRKLRQRKPDTKVIIITAYASIESAVASMKIGAYDYLVKPIDHSEIKSAIRKALEAPAENFQQA